MEQVHPSIVTRHNMYQLVIQMSLSENILERIAKSFKKIEVDSKILEIHASKIIEILKSSETEEEMIAKIEKL